MAFVEIPWARRVTSPNLAVTSATPPFNVWATASNEYLDAYTDAPVPAGEVTLEVRYSKPTDGTEYAFGLGLDAPFEWIYPPSDLDGGGFYEGWRVAWPPVGVTVWRPKWVVPVGGRPLSLSGRPRPFGTRAATDFSVSGPITLTPVDGVLRRWEAETYGSTTIYPPKHVLSGINGPWVSATGDAAGKALAVRLNLDGPGRVSVPFYSSGGPLTVHPSSFGGSVALVDAGGAVDNGDGTITIPPSTRCLPRWGAPAGNFAVKMTKTATANYTVSYGPAYVVFAPTLTGIDPAAGPDTGGTLVNIVGTDLTGATAVDFGGTAGTGLTVDPSGSLATVTSPAHTAGPAPVTITTPAGTSNAETFTFEAPAQPALTQILPAIGRPGTVALIRGANLAGVTGVSFGGVFGLDLVATPDALLVTVPQHTPGPVDVIAVHPDGETAPLEFTYDDVPVPADVSPRSWQIAQALLDAAFLCGAECARAFVTTDATPEGPPPGGCPCQLTATIIKDGYKTADGRRLVRSATIKLSLHQCTPIPQADEIPDPDTESDYALRQAETRDQMLRGLATARRQPSSVLGRCQTKQASEGWVHVSTTGGMSLYTMEVTVD